MTKQQENLVLNFDNIEHSHPMCKHGPCLLFVKQSETENKYYSCSACRDSVDCNIHIPYVEEQKLLPNQYKSLIEYHEQAYYSYISEIKKLRKNARSVRKKFKEASSHNANKRNYCKTCMCLFSTSNLNIHQDHDCAYALNNKQMKQPCQNLLKPLQKKESNAQFFFKETFINYLIDKVLLVGQWDGILCIGCPTIFEALNVQDKIKRKKLFLLDFDQRLINFYPRKKFLMYNMFNGHFFEDSIPFQQFLSSIQNCLILCDPPFGALFEALAQSIKNIHTYGQKTIQHWNLILFSPYFHEKWIQKFFTLFMLDYKIEYTSLPHLCRGRKGSPVRMFTDCKLNTFPPLDDNNYKYCDYCQRYTLLTNKHCFECNSCTSKDGLPYYHCKLCQRCVKFERVHFTFEALLLILIIFYDFNSVNYIDIMITAILVFNHHGQPRITKFYEHFPIDVEQKIIRETYQLVSKRDVSQCNFLESGLLVGKSSGDHKLIYRHYATLYFVFCIDSSESAYDIYELIHSFVECLDRCFENVCELDLIFHADKVHHILQEICLGGIILERNMSEILQAVNEQSKIEKQESGLGGVAGKVKSVVDTKTAKIRLDLEKKLDSRLD
ncbi:unnamed protein product [Didymodactylos carnosus]|uniref:AP complex mu/sigma subunit domain-containing protein n=1 Tax=Didymodactylos carnosus TaxID=1234261 RepID=A0A814EC81_9BILA|nr:unnamed protein product [Didymodactylos carnosus]CAF3742139.1 unnamed protein product [Didymodactylos carnosus]